MQEVPNKGEGERGARGSPPRGQRVAADHDGVWGEVAAARRSASVTASRGSPHLIEINGSRGAI